MKWTIRELLQSKQNITFDEDVEIDDSNFDENPLIHRIEDVHISGFGYLDENGNHFYVKIRVTGVMICPDAITNEEIEVDLDTETSETYVWDVTPEDDGEREVTDEVIDLLPAVIDTIMLEVPLQVTDVAEDEYPEGEGWKVYSEAEYQESRRDQTDPRLAKLKQFKSEQ